LLHVSFVGRRAELAVGCGTGNWTAGFNFPVAAYACHVKTFVPVPNQVESRSYMQASCSKRFEIIDMEV